jgi:hypothetical protein
MWDDQGLWEKYIFLLGRSEGKSHLEDLGGDGRVILDSIFKKMGSGS